MIKGNCLALVCDLLADERGAYCGADNVRLASYVAHAKRQTHLALAQTNRRIFTVHDCLRSFCWPRKLRKHHAHNQTLDDDAKYELHTKDDDGAGTLDADDARAEAQRRLGLDGKEQRGGKGIDVDDTRRPGRVVVVR